MGSCCWNKECWTADWFRPRYSSREIFQRKAAPSTRADSFSCLILQSEGTLHKKMMPLEEGILLYIKEQFLLETYDLSF